MIDFISSWASQLVVALIASTLIEMLLPNGKSKKYVKTLIGVYIVFCILSPLIEGKEQFSLASIEKELEANNNLVINKKNKNQDIEELYIEEFEKDVIKQVEKQGYIVKKCSVDIEIDATKENAGINKIILVISNNKKEQSSYVKNIEKVEISINNTNIEENKKEQAGSVEKNNKSDSSSSESNSKETENSETKQNIDNYKELRQFLSDYYQVSENKIDITEN